MDRNLIFYTHPQSRGATARWMLEEVGVPYHSELLSYGPAMKSPDYLAINPMGKVPALRHGETIVTECAAICAYLADAFPEAELAPPQAERGAYYRWLFFAAGPLETAIVDKSLGRDIPDDPKLRGRSGYGSVELAMTAFESMLTQSLAHTTYLAGHRFSAADVYVGSHIRWGLQFGTLERKAVFEDYWAKLADRPALARAAEKDANAMGAVR